MTAGHTRELTLFGGLPRRGESRFEGRSRGAMLQHTFTREGSDFDCRVDRDGLRFIFASTRHSPQSDIYIKSLNGTAVTQLTSDPSSDIQPAFSPDNSKVAFASNRTGNWDIWVVSLDGQQPMQITHSPMDEVHPSWSPDGKVLAYSALPPNDRQWELWVSPAEEHSTSTFIGYGLFPEWSPVDNRILFQRSRQRGSRWFSVWTIELVDGEPRYPTEVASSADYALITPSWSRDAQHIAYASVTNLPSIDPEFGATYESSDIWVVDAQGGSRVRLTDGHSVNFLPSWSPSGRVLFSSMRAGHENIWSIMPTIGNATYSPVTRDWPEQNGPPVVIHTSGRG